MKTSDQLDEWVKGNSIHNDENNECCPDFSCCNGGHICDIDERVRFKRAFDENDKYTIYEMLNIFLGKEMLMKATGPKVLTPGNYPTEVDTIH